MFFYLIGGLVMVLGAIAAILLEEHKDGAEVQGSYWSQITSTFRWSYLKGHKDLLLVLSAVTLWGIAQQIYFPYLLIYLNHYLNISTINSSILVAVAILVGGIGSAYPFGILTDRIGRKKVALMMVIAEMIGLVLFSFTRSFVWVTITGILWLAPISGWTIATSAWSKDLFPEDKRGQFSGYLILFSVMFTMVPGPLIGSWISTTYGNPIVLDGQAGVVPPPLIFLVGGIFTLLAALPLFFAKTKPAVIPQTDQA
jgi:MFS family permease